ncbi:MAG: tRNA uracil 4-sulfurtransferase ThiI [Erysipelotrichaceae bacterium]
MNTEQNSLQFDRILVRFGELSTKGKNKKIFINRLLSNTKDALKAFDALTYEKTHDRLYIVLNGEDHEAVAKVLKNVFGIYSFSFAAKVNSDIDQIVETAVKLATPYADTDTTFKIDTRRQHKLFYMVSDEINRAVATPILRDLHLKVDVKKPMLRITIEVHQFDTYIMTDKILGAGGYPVGVGGKALLMLSGGIDSPVAAYMTQKRGVMVEAIHFASPPYTSARAQQKVMDLASITSMYQGKMRVHVIPFTDLQLAIYNNCDIPYAITIMRRMMYRIAERYAREHKLGAIVNGECLGQVASQTLESMDVINNVVSIPVLRPLISFDKLDIIEIAKKIETYETSIQPFEDCCTIFTPKNPVTKPTIRKAEYNENKFDFEPLIEQCLANVETILVYPEMKAVTKQEEEDLF